MNALKRWLPIALCCLPGIAVAAIVGVGIAGGGAILGGPLGLGLITLAILACPLSMGWMMRGTNRNTASRDSTMMADCCMPSEATSASSEAGSSADRLAGLRAKREALERELAEMQTE